jgi:MOSC domain-containing protein YiiM
MREPSWLYSLTRKNETFLMPPSVIAVSSSPTHRFSKQVLPEIVLVAGHGVEGDAHAGVTVKHRSRVAKDPSRPNLRQVHLMHSELFAAIAESGIAVRPGEMGENITTIGLDILALPTGTRLRIGADAVVEITGLRNPCAQIEAFAPGLLAQVVERRPDGALVRKAGVMGVVLAGGTVRSGDPISVELPAEPHVALAPV